jgi:hypothetical protein
MDVSIGILAPVVWAVDLKNLECESIDEDLVFS